MKTLPHIVIPSYPGKDRTIRKERFEHHIQQRMGLKEIFEDEFRIVTCASTYDNQMKKRMREYGFDAFFLKNRTWKWKKMNKFLRQLYREKDKDKAILFMDDDVLPYKENKIVLYQNTIPKLKYLLRNPQSVPASCCFFHCCGLKAFMYTQGLLEKYSEDDDYNICRIGPVGWAIFIKSDLGILYEEKDVIDPKYGYRYHGDDFPLRAKCIVHEKTVVENHHIAFRCIKASTKSTFFSEQQSRLRTQKILEALWVKRYPNYLFYKGRKEKQFLSSTVHYSRLGHSMKKEFGKLDMTLLTKKSTIKELCGLSKLNPTQVEKHLYHIKTNHKDFRIRFEKGRYFVEQRQ